MIAQVSGRSAPRRSGGSRLLIRAPPLDDVVGYVVHDRNR